MRFPFFRGLIIYVGLLFPLNANGHCSLTAQTTADKGDQSFTDQPRCSGSQILDDLKDKDEQTHIENEILKPLLKRIRDAWIPTIPSDARPPVSKPGAATISFTIAADGALKKMTLLNTWGKVPIARGAWDAIATTSRDPFPANVHRQTLSFQIQFMVNTTCSP